MHVGQHESVELGDEDEVRGDQQRPDRIEPHEAPAVGGALQERLLEDVAVRGLPRRTVRFADRPGVRLDQRGGCGSRARSRRHLVLRESRGVSLRRAAPSDLDPIVETLVESHLDYVWEVWALPGPDRPRAPRRRSCGVDLELLGIPYREIWMHDDAAAVAIWIPPDPVDHNPHATAEVAQVARDDLRRSSGGDRSRGSGCSRSHRPTEPHWFLATMGTRPERQRQGLGNRGPAPGARRARPAAASRPASRRARRRTWTSTRASASTVLARLDELPG